MNKITYLVAATILFVCIAYLSILSAVEYGAREALREAAKKRVYEPVIITSPVGGCQWQVMPGGSVVPVFVDSSRIQVCSDTQQTLLK